MSIELFQRVCLTVDIPEHGLKKEDVATVVEKLPAGKESNASEGFALEVATATGETAAVIFVPASSVRSLSNHEILHARRLARTV